MMLAVLPVVFSLRFRSKTVQTSFALYLRCGLRCRPCIFRFSPGCRVGTAQPGAAVYVITDVTEFAVNGRKLYLSPVIDLFNNEVISYSLSERPVMNMVENMLDQAFKKLNPHEHPVLHSDQGWQYRMRRYQNILKEHGIKQSMSRKGNCLDNAVVECFFGTLKSECFYLDEFSNISELKDAVTEYIEYYNSRRISLKLKGLTPIEYRNQTYMPRV